MSPETTNALLVLFTAVLSIFTGLLWHSTKKLWEETRAVSETAKIAADAAQRTAEISERALLSVERPYLFVTAHTFDVGIKVTDDNGSHYHPVVTYSVGNHGKLPAIIDMVCAEVVYAPDGKLAAPLSVHDAHPLLTERVIESNGNRPNLKCSDGVIDAGVVNRPDLTNHEIFFWVVIHYHGPFTKAHKTSACWRASFSLDRNNITLVQHGHDDYNYST